MILIIKNSAKTTFTNFYVQLKDFFIFCLIRWIALQYGHRIQEEQNRASNGDKAFVLFFDPVEAIVECSEYKFKINISSMVELLSK